MNKAAMPKLHKLQLKVAKLAAIIHSFKRVSVFLLLLTSSKKFANVHWKIAVVVSFDDACYIHKYIHKLY